MIMRDIKIVVVYLGKPFLLNILEWYRRRDAEAEDVHVGWKRL